jgi:hypothetical protein
MCTYSFWRHLWPRIKQLKQIFGKKKKYTEGGGIHTKYSRKMSKKPIFCAMPKKSWKSKKKFQSPRLV